MIAPLVGIATGVKCPVCKGVMTIEQLVGYGLDREGRFVERIYNTRCQACGWQGRQWIKEATNDDNA